MIPDAGKLLASTGCSSDGHMCIWDRRGGALLARQPLLAGSLGACFTEDGSSVITTGKEHFKVRLCEGGDVRLTLSPPVEH